MSLDEIELGKSERLDLDELPDELKDVTVEKALWESDRYGRNCLIVEYKTSGKLPLSFTQKYTPMHLALMAEIMHELKLKNIKDFKGNLVKVPMRIGFDRMFPDCPLVISDFAINQKKKRA